MEGEKTFSIRTEIPAGLHGEIQKYQSRRHLDSGEKITFVEAIRELLASGLKTYRPKPVTEEITK